MPARINQSATTERYSLDGSDTPRTPSKRASLAPKTPSKPANKTSRNALLVYPSPELTPRRSILDYGISPPSRNATHSPPPETPSKTRHGGLNPSTGSRVIFSGLGNLSGTPISGSHPVKQEQEEVPSSTLLGRGRRPLHLTYLRIRLKLPCRLEFRQTRAKTASASSVASQTQARQIKAEEGEHTLFLHDGAIGIFQNGERLRPFQASDLHLLIEREVWNMEGENEPEEMRSAGYVLAYDMGCGKTATSIALIVCNPPPKDFEGAKPTLVIVPSKGIMDHWMVEVKKFAPHLKVCYYGSYSNTLLMNADIILCTYTQIQHQYDAFKPKDGGASKADKYYPLFQLKWYRVITDEAHQYRNPETRTFLGVCALQKMHGLCLTGTPAQLINLLELIHGLLPSFDVLGHAYQKLDQLPVFKRSIYPCGKKNRVITDPEAKRLLNILHQAFFIRRRKDDDVTGDGTPLVNLPPRTDRVIDVELTHWERLVYQHIVDLKLSIFAKITHLRQACDHPVLVSGILETTILGDETDPEYETRYNFSRIKTSLWMLRIFTQLHPTEEYQSSRILAMMNILQKRPKGEKTIIFTHFTSLIPAITYALNHAGIHWTEYSGGMGIKGRQQALKIIAKDDDCTVMIISIKVGGVGLNIIECNSVILMDPWWNPFFEEQAISRVHRIGQKKPVTVYHLVAKNTLEEYIMETQEIKRRMIERGESDVKFEKDAELDLSTMRTWLH